MYLKIYILYLLNYLAIYRIFVFILKHRIMKKIIPLCFILMLIFSQCVEDEPLVIENSNSSIVLYINEIFSTGSPDWLEIYNPSDQSIDMSGFYIYDSPTLKYQLPQNTQINGKGFLVLYCDDSNTGLHTNFKLSSGGETVCLEDTEEKTIDCVTFPALEDGIAYSRISDGDGNWIVTPSPSQGVSNAQASEPPVVSNFSITPAIPTNEDAISFVITVTDDNQISEVVLHYTINETDYQTLMTATGNEFSATIDAQPTFTEIFYYIEATDNEENTTYYPADGNTNPNSFTVSASSAVELFINEVLSTGSPDWLEIYNPTDQAIDISGFYLYDEGTQDNKYPIPSGTQIEAGSFIVFYCDDDSTGMHTNFKLSSGGETVTFEDNQEQLIDQVTFPELSDGYSYGRNPDGQDDWNVFSQPTQGTSNSGGTVFNFPPQFNNFSITSSPTPDDNVAIEIEVTDDNSVSTVSLHYFIDQSETVLDMTNESGNLYTTTIPPQANGTQVFYYIEAIDNQDKSAFFPAEAPTERLSYLVEDVPLAIFINEFLASNDACCQDENSEYDDWIEIYNAGTTAVDIGGMYITDDNGNITQYQIPTDDSQNTTIQPGGFLVLWADDQTAQGSLHLNFKLSKGGESIILTSPDGSTLIDAIDYPAQDTDVSYGRSPDGSDNWQTFSSPTPGSANQ